MGRGWPGVGGLWRGKVVGAGAPGGLGRGKRGAWGQGPGGGLLPPLRAPDAVKEGRVGASLTRWVSSEALNLTVSLQR